MRKYRNEYRLWINVSASVSPGNGVYVKSVGSSGVYTTKEGPYQDRPLLYPFHHFLSLLWSCFSPGSA